MITTEVCKTYLDKKGLTDQRIEEIRDYLYAISREIARNSVNDYKQSLKKKPYGKTQTTTTEQ
ncbi:MAG: hypothetical protein RIQ41_109 [Candidatus Parcubacteria bacterium]|jgi:hypothetical protein